MACVCDALIVARARVLGPNLCGRKIGHNEYKCPLHATHRGSPFDETLAFFIKKKKNSSIFYVLAWRKPVIGTSVYYTAPIIIPALTSRCGNP